MLHFTVLIYMNEFQLVIWFKFHLILLKCNIVNDQIEWELSTVSRGPNLSFLNSQEICGDLWNFLLMWNEVCRRQFEQLNSGWTALNLAKKASLRNLFLCTTRSWLIGPRVLHQSEWWPSASLYRTHHVLYTRFVLLFYRTII